MHHRNNFDGLRLIAAYAVLISHQFALTGAAEPRHFDESLGQLAVLVFFSISGYLVAQSWASDPSLWRFSVRRLLRVWPGLAGVVLITAFVLGPLMSDKSAPDYFADPKLVQYMSNLLLKRRDELPFEFSGNVRPTWINGSLWTIPLEARCYLILGLLGVAGLLKPRLLLPIGYLLVACVGLSFIKSPGHLFSLGLYFFAGASVYQVRDHLTQRVLMWLSVPLAAAIALAAYSGLKPVALLLAIPIAVVVIGKARAPILTDAGKFGDFSYGVYLYAFPVQQTMIWLMKDKVAWPVLLGCTVIVTSVFAFLSWHLIEKHALKLKPKPRGVAAYGLPVRLSN